MISSEVQRTLVKSPPELWAELSDPDALARHLGELGEIRITRTEPETLVEWEADGTSGRVDLKPSGWGTKVTLTVTRDLAQPEADEAQPAEAETTTQPEAEEAQPAEAETTTQPEAEDPQAAEAETIAESGHVASDAAIEHGSPAAEDSQPWQAEDGSEPGEYQPPAQEELPEEWDAPAADWEAAQPTSEWPAQAVAYDHEQDVLPRRGFFVRLLARLRRDPAPEIDLFAEELESEPAVAEEEQLPADDEETVATHAIEAEPPPAEEGVATHPIEAESPPAEEDVATHPIEAEQPPATQPQAVPDLEPSPEEQPPEDLAAELQAAEEQVTAVLTATLDRLGAAHHRPFSRG
jgi:hypothetical protein